ncbi:autotransporter assembly complex protein TamA [Vibrio mangrovi]|uniref:Translocation and assembly module subunit TamA n=1 Tax=Vibrio mangrovi TaxID=474394 RepID=A0A1Y6IZR7_9VIBR|nr:autotransporter assembly complex family protein [Vibrio mangrovi]MDW6002829.1 autotransporter assembly complex family protein [Vibrio mangrovi]SMS02320.1 Translocation and assembly module TamA precursor [Vibrio mangrovi]
MRRYLTLFCLLSVLCFSAVSAERQISLKINGLSGDLYNNVEAYLSSIPQSDYSPRLRFRARIEDNISQALQALGYYHPVISFEYDQENSEIQADVEPGPPTYIDSADIQLTGEARSDEDFIRLVENSRLKKGEILNHEDYEQLKSGLQSLALERGYFNGTFAENRLEILADENLARVVLHFNSGIRYRFGQTIMVGSQIDPERVASLQTYRPGDPYLVSKVGEFNQRLASTDWFASVLVEPDLSHLDTQRDLPMNVTLTPASKNQIETGLGYSTDVGPEVLLKWNKPWFNNRGHSFSSRFSLSEPEQVVSASYKIPLEDVLNQYYQIQYGLKRVDNLDTQSIESNLSLERHWRLSNGWHRTIFTRYLIENYEQGDLDDVGQFVLPGITFTRTRIRGKRLLTWGDKETLTLEYGNENFHSETDILRIQAGTSWIRTYNDRHRGLLRLDGGANLVDDFSQVSPSLRFFAGGDNSIRGYGYESISPRDASGSRSGAKYLATASLEYQYNLYGNWWGALFYDYGDAFNDTPDWKRGTGFGVRWVSPIGPVRLDFAWGLDTTPGDEFQIHFTLGPEL